jgi:rubrerythrin
MAQITEKELSAISDLLSIEQNLVAKYRAYASIATDNALKDQYEAIAARHQRHYDELYANLK